MVEVLEPSSPSSTFPASFSGLVNSQCDQPSLVDASERARKALSFAASFASLADQQQVRYARNDRSFRFGNIQKDQVTLKAALIGGVGQ